MEAQRGMLGFWGCGGMGEGAFVCAFVCSVLFGLGGGEGNEDEDAILIFTSPSFHHVTIKGLEINKLHISFMRERKRKKEKKKKSEKKRERKRKKRKREREREKKERAKA